MNRQTLPGEMVPTPHFLFALPKRKRAVDGPKEKGAVPAEQRQYSSIQPGFLLLCAANLNNPCLLPRAFRFATRYPGGKWESAPQTSASLRTTSSAQVPHPHFAASGKTPSFYCASSSRGRRLAGFPRGPKRGDDGAAHQSLSPHSAAV